MAKLNELYLRIDPKKFHFLKFILEGYDNLAILSSFDCSEGVVVIKFSQPMLREVFCLLKEIAPLLNGVSNKLPGAVK